MEKLESKNNNTNLLDVGNYKKELNSDTFHRCVNIYINIGNHCVKYLLSNLKTTNKKYLNFIIKRGLTTLEHVHNLLFIYTKNDNMVNHHLEKAYLYYVEFVSQIGEDTNQFIKLNSKDATLFVYKKTIYDINTDYKKNMRLTKKDMKFANMMKKFTEIYNDVIFNMIALMNNNLITNMDKLNKYMEYNKKFEKIILNIYDIFLNNDYKNFIKIMNEFIDDLVKMKITISEYIKYLLLLTNKYNKKKVTYDNFKKKLYSPKKNIVYKKTPLKYINWLMN
jgi:hypothetical protein